MPQPYPDQGNSISEKLLGSKLARKQAEEDVKLLANRIALLKSEEEKAMKKINETKKKATDIMSMRKRNTATQREKEERFRDKAR